VIDVICPGRKCGGAFMRSQWAKEKEIGGTVRYVGGAECNTCGLEFALSEGAAKMLWEEQQRQGLPPA
jgi:hypothetical protein